MRQENVWSSHRQVPLHWKVYVVVLSPHGRGSPTRHRRPLRATAREQVLYDATVQYERTVAVSIRTGRRKRRVGRSHPNQMIPCANAASLFPLSGSIAMLLVRPSLAETTGRRDHLQAAIRPPWRSPKGKLKPKTESRWKHGGREKQQDPSG